MSTGYTADAIDGDRLLGIMRRFFETEGNEAVLNWEPSQFERLQADLHDAITREYPELGMTYGFRVVQRARVKANDPYQITVQVVRPVGEFTVAI